MSVGSSIALSSSLIPQVINDLVVLLLIICKASNDTDHDMELYMIKIISDQVNVYVFVAVVDQDVE